MVTGYHVPASPSLQKLLESWRGKNMRDAAPGEPLLLPPLRELPLPGALWVLGRGVRLHLRMLWAPLVQGTDPTAAAGQADSVWVPPHPRPQGTSEAAMPSVLPSPAPANSQGQNEGKKVSFRGKMRSGYLPRDPASRVLFSALLQSFSVMPVISLVSSVPQFS